MNQVTLEAEKREVTTKGTLNSLIKSGKIPAVAYGDNEAPQALVLDGKQLQAAMHTESGRNALINLKIGDSTHAVLIKEIQRHPLTRAIRHVDLHRVSLKKKIETPVPIHVKGEAPGVKLNGGILEHIVRDIRVRCLPTEIPNAFEADVSALQIGQGIKVKDLPVPAGVELLIDKESIVLHVVAPAKIEEPTPAVAPAAGATAAEPEVIKKGKTEEGAEGAAPAAGDKKAAAPAAAAGEKKAEKK